LRFYFAQSRLCVEGFLKPRATGTFSDLALMLGGSLFAELEEWRMEEAFDESRLPLERFPNMCRPDFFVIP
jgi:hypothetical protein